MSIPHSTHTLTIEEIEESRSINITGTVIDHFPRPQLSNCPYTSPSTDKYFSCTLLHNRAMVDVYFFGDYVDKLKYLSDGDSVRISAPSLVVYPVNSKRVVLDDKKARYFIHFCLSIDSSMNLPSAFSIVIKSGRIMNEKNNAILNHPPLSDIPWRDVSSLKDSLTAQQLSTSDRNLSNSSIPAPVTPNKRLRIDHNSPPLHAPEVDYITLQECLQNLQKFVNVLMVVVSYSGLKRTRGSDKFCVIYSVIDNSDPDPRRPSKLKLFGNDPVNFPRVLRVGDIIRARRVRAGIFESKIELVGNVNHNHKLQTSILVIHRKIDYLTSLSRFVSSDLNATASSDVASSSQKIVNNICLNSDHWDIEECNHKRYSYNPVETASIESLYLWSQEVLYYQSIVAEIAQDKVQTCFSLFKHRFQGSSPENSPIGAECDVVGIVVDVFVPQNPLEPGHVLLWDGSFTPDMFSSDTTSKRFTSESTPDIFNRVAIAYNSSRVFSSYHDFKTCESMCKPIIESLLNTAFVGKLEGVVRVDTIGDEANYCLSYLKPGMWVRFRNLKITYSPGQLSYDPNELALVTSTLPVATIFGDSHVCALLPRYKEVKDVISKMNCPFCLPQPTRPVRLTQSRNGHPYTPLALCLTMEAPAKFCVLSKIISWWPNDVSRFVSDDNGEFLFALRVGDDTAFTDIIFADEDAEHFLNTSTSNFKDSISLREKISTKLHFLKNSGKLIDVYLKSYYVSENYDNAKPGPGRKRVRPAKQNQHSNATATIKRFRGFNICLFDMEDD